MSDSPSVAYGLFADQISQASVQRVFRTFAVAREQGVRQFHLLFQSTGGFVSDGLCLYSFFRSQVLDLTIYNAGSVHSIAAIAFLGGQHRKTAKHGTFMFHRTAIGSNQARVAELRGLMEAAALDDARTEIVLRENLHLSLEQWEILGQRDLVLSAEDAISAGVAEGIEEFRPPPGGIVLNI